jgi:catalase
MNDFFQGPQGLRAGGIQVGGVPQFIVERQPGHFEKADPAYAAGVREALAAAGKPVEDAVPAD